MKMRPLCKTVINDRPFFSCCASLNVPTLGGDFWKGSGFLAELVIQVEFGMDRACTITGFSSRQDRASTAALSHHCLNSTEN
jgi:hypothetical protein